MVSCTEFIPLYSELFKYIESKGDHDAVIRYWEYISDTYVAERLGQIVSEKGLEGCWDYWAKALSEEAADFVMEYDDEKQDFTIDMRYCPSKGMLLELKHMEPYWDYCGHCAVLYSRILDRYGICSESGDANVDQAQCLSRHYIEAK